MKLQFGGLNLNETLDPANGILIGLPKLFFDQLKAFIKPFEAPQRSLKIKI